MEIFDLGWDRADFENRFAPIIDRMLADRGWILNCYAQVEFLAADLIVKARKFPDYVAFADQQVPRDIGARYDRLKQICGSGPLQPYDFAILSLVEHLIAKQDVRHLFVHGLMSVHIERGTERCAMHLRRYVPARRGALETKDEILLCLR